MAGDSILLPPGQPEITGAIENWAYANGQNPQDFTLIYDGTSPNLSQFAPDNQQLTNLVNSLPLTFGAQDTLTSWENNYAASVQAPSAGYLSSPATAQTLMEFGEAETMLGGTIAAFCEYAGPDLPYGGAVAGGMIAGGGLIWLAGKFMSMEE
jgi:hypothetical protein